MSVIAGPHVGPVPSGRFPSGARVRSSSCRRFAVLAGRGRAGAGAGLIRAPRGRDEVMLHDRARIHVQGAPAGTAARASDAKRTCRAAAPTAATVRAGETWCSLRRLAERPAGLPRRATSRLGRGSGSGSAAPRRRRAGARVAGPARDRAVGRTGTWRVALGAAGRGQRVLIARGGTGGRGTSASRRPRARPRASPSAGCRARRGGSTCA